MAWRQLGDKPLSETMMVSLLTWRMYASLGLNELKACVNVFHWSTRTIISNNDKTKNVYIIVGYAVSIIAYIIFLFNTHPEHFIVGFSLELVILIWSSIH